MKPVFSAQAPAPVGHYSQAIVANGFVFVSGQLPIKPKTGETVVGLPAEQAKQALQNLKAVLEAAGSSFSEVVKITLYISDVSMRSEINEVYGQFFGQHRPARTTVFVKEFPFGFCVCVDAIAVVKKK